jgi:hypothetical protein
VVEIVRGGLEVHEQWRESVMTQDCSGEH